MQLTNALVNANMLWLVTRWHPHPGDLMVIGDMFSLTAQNPLIGPNLDEFGPRFPDMSCAFDKELRALAHACASEQGFALREGVYAQMTGPTYETPAEIRMLRTLGADAVGMSTVPEVVVARHGGMRVLGVSCFARALSSRDALSV